MADSKAPHYSTTRAILPIRIAVEVSILTIILEVARLAFSTLQ
jgi:hypothetical protein